MKFSQRMNGSRANEFIRVVQCRKQRGSALLVIPSRLADRQCSLPADSVDAIMQNWIRLVVLMAMLGSTGYYALADTRHAITFNMTMILLCLLSMGLGTVLRIRLYLALGFAGLMVDLVSLLYKVLVLMERSARMTIVGSLVLLIGALLVFGAIYYKTSKSRIDALVSGWRQKLARWR